MQISRRVNLSNRKYDVDQLYLEGSVLKKIRPNEQDDLIFGFDLDLDEAVEYAADYGKGVRVFTGIRRYTRRQRKYMGTGWPKQ